MKLAIVPARGGSKRIPRKNVRPFLGRPVISYPIAAAKQSKLFDVVIVSTDDAEIAEVAKSFGAEVIIRPPELSDDFTPTVSVVRHVISNFEQREEVVDGVCYIYPVTPLLTSDILFQAYEKLPKVRDKFVFPVTLLPISPRRAIRLDEQGFTSNFDSSAFDARSQDLEAGYADAGQFYWATRDVWMTQDNVHRSGALVVFGKWDSVDVDVEAFTKRSNSRYN